MQKMMIKVNKDFSKIPNGLLSNSCLKKREEAMLYQDGDKCGPYYYRDETVLTALYSIYNGKCAYCETKSRILEVEHYRPKKAVTEDKNHKGYYWLGLEWSNLFLACDACNNQGAKGNHFPIKGTRLYYPILPPASNHIEDQTSHAILLAEHPLILNPEINHPENHLTFDALGGLVGTTEEGEATIQVLNLNDGWLYEARQKIVNDQVLRIKSLIEKAEEGFVKGVGFRSFLKDIFNELKSRLSGAEEYTLWGRFLYEEFVQCIVKRLPEKYQRSIEKAFEQYKNNLL